MQLTESNITLRIRQVDISLVESLIDTVQQQYKQKTKKDVHLKIDSDNFLPSESCGGVELLASKGKYITEKMIHDYKINHFVNKWKMSMSYNSYSSCKIDLNIRLIVF